MAGYLRKYAGQYRVVANYNLATNDFPRKKDGLLDQSFDDLYIPCSSGTTIIHNERNVLIVITLTVKKGHNVLRQVYANENNCDANNVNWQDAQKYLVENGVIECTEDRKSVV